MVSEPHVQPSETSTPEDRRVRWRRSIAAKVAAGFPVESDARFLGWIEEWIAGDIPISEVQRRCAEFLTCRTPSTVDMVDLTTDTILDDVRQRVPEIAGVLLTSPEDRAERARKIGDAWGLEQD